MQSFSQKTKSRKKKTLKGSIILWEFYEGELSKAIYSGEKVFCRILSLEECHDGKGLGGLSKGTCLRTKLGKAIALEGVSWGQLLEVSCSGENYSRIIVQDKGSWALVPTDFHVGQLSGRYLSGE